MAILEATRQPLDDALSRLGLTLFLVAGPANGIEHRVHDTAERMVIRGWGRVFLVTNLYLLTDLERRRWRIRDGRFAVLTGPERTAAVTGHAAPDLLTTEGSPSVAKIRSVMSGEKAAWPVCPSR